MIRDYLYQARHMRIGRCRRGRGRDGYDQMRGCVVHRIERRGRIVKQDGLERHPRLAPSITISIPRVGFHEKAIPLGRIYRTDTTDNGGAATVIFLTGELQRIPLSPIRDIIFFFSYNNFFSRLVSILSLLKSNATGALVSSGATVSSASGKGRSAMLAVML